MKRMILVLVSVLLSATLAAADRQAPAPTMVDSAERALKLDHPGVQINRSGTSRLAIYGRGMSPGATPDLAVRGWLDRYGDALAIPVDQLDERSHNAVGKESKFTVFRFEQTLDGLPVEGSRTRILVHNGAENEVVYVGARSLVAPSESFRVDLISAGQAVRNVRALEAYDHLDAWWQPFKVILPGRNGAPAERAWKFLGSRSDGFGAESYTFFVGTHDGIILEVRDNFVNGNPASPNVSGTVTGTVSGMVTPGKRPDLDTNLPEAQPLRGALIKSQDFPYAASIAYTDARGVYEVEYGRFHTVTSKGDGQWFDLDFGNIDIQILPTVGNPASATPVLHNPGDPDPDPDLTQRLNVLNHGTMAHDFYKERQPGFSGIDKQLEVDFSFHPDPPFFCNAGFLPPDPLPGAQESFYFFPGGCGAGGTCCPSQAFSSVIGHEYGHFIQFSLDLFGGLGTIAFGEGFAESFAILLYDDPVIGLDAFGDGTGPARDTVAANQQYPCVDSAHTCGLVLSGVWWDIKLQFEASPRPGGLERARQLFTDWSQMTSGHGDGQSASCSTAIEVLMVDDDDANLSNGTPRSTEICAAFASHNIINCTAACP